MSNQVSMMLSFIFFAFFIVFSSETIAYQTQLAKSMSKTNNIAIYIQENGYDIDDLHLLNQLEEFNDYEINAYITENGFTSYHITTIKNYQAFSSLFDYMTGDITCKLIVYRKE